MTTWTKIEPLKSGPPSAESVSIYTSPSGSNPRVYIPVHMVGAGHVDIFGSGDRIAILQGGSTYKVAARGESVRFITLPRSLRHGIPHGRHNIPHTIEDGMIVIDLAPLRTEINQIAAE